MTLLERCDPYLLTLRAAARQPGAGQLDTARHHVFKAIEAGDAPRALEWLLAAETAIAGLQSDAKAPATKALATLREILTHANGGDHGR